MKSNLNKTSINSSIVHLFIMSFNKHLVTKNKLKLAPKLSIFQMQTNRNAEKISLKDVE